MKLDTQHSGETKFNSNSRRRKKDSVTSKTSAIRKASSFQFRPPPLAAALPSPALASPPIVTARWLCGCVVIYIYASCKANISLLGRFFDVDGQFIRQLRKSGVAGRKWASNRKRNEPARWFGVEIYRICHFLSPLSAFLPFGGKL